MEILLAAGAFSSAMNPNAALMTWESLLAMFPHDLTGLAKTTGAATRWRKVTTGEQLLWMCLVYAQAFMSLRVTAGLSGAFAQLTEGAVKYRVQHAAPFLSAILTHLLNCSVKTIVHARSGAALRLIDSTTLSVPGSVGIDWRIHACYLPGIGFDRVDLTDGTGAESSDRAGYGRTDISMSDQGYCRSKDLHHIRACGAYSIVRAYLKNIRLTDELGEPIKIAEVLDRAEAGHTSTVVLVPHKDSPPLKARLIVRILPEKKAEENRKKLRARASRNGLKVTEQGLRLAGFFVVLTTVPEEILSDDEVVELYRFRWQIELLFKRWKSLLNLDKVTAHEPALVRPFCLAKLIEAAVLEREGNAALDEYARTCADDDAGDDDEQTARPACTMWRVTVVYHAAFVQAVLSAFPVSREQRMDIVDRMREGKRRRRNASTKAAELLHRIAQGPSYAKVPPQRAAA